jgi:hypothetical protein
MSLSVVDTSVGNGYGFKSEMAISDHGSLSWSFYLGMGPKNPPKKYVTLYTGY